MSSTRLCIRTAAAVTAVLAVLSAGQAGAAIRVDDRPGPRGSGFSIQPSYPDFVDRYVASHSARVSRTAQSTPVSQSGQGFDWEAAGLGASMTAALLIVLGAAIGVARRSRARSAAA